MEREDHRGRGRLVRHRIGRNRHRQEICGRVEQAGAARTLDDARGGCVLRDVAPERRALVAPRRLNSSEIKVHYSDLNDSRRGDRVTTRVAASDESRPVANTANSSNAPPLVRGRRPPRSMTAGVMASAAQTAPAIKPPARSSVFSAATIRRKWARL